MFGGDIGDGVDSDGVCVSGGVDGLLVFGVIGLAPLGWVRPPPLDPAAKHHGRLTTLRLPSHCCSLARSAVRHPRV